MPIYDATDLQDLRIGDHGIDLSNLLPYEEDLGPDTIAVVGYSINRFEKEDSPIIRINFNILYVIVLADFSARRNL